jgi:DNA/RNA endonuclease G (NUC1)
MVWLAVVLTACSADRLTAPTLTPSGHASYSVTETGPNLLIVELIADPSAVSDANGEWLKLYNPGPTDVTLTNFKIQSSSGTTIYTGTQTVESHTIASGYTIPVGGCAVLGNNTNSSTNGGLIEVYSYGTSITLGNNATDWVTIRSNTGALLDSVAYSTGGQNTATPPARIAVAPSYTVKAGIARAVVDPSIDHVVMATSNWVDGTTAWAASGTGDKGSPNSCTYTYRVGGGSTVGPLDHVTLSGAPTVVAGSSIQLNGVAQDANGKTVAGATYAWSSSDESIATVDASGKVTGVAAGATPATITVKATSDGIEKTASQSVSVTNPVIAWIDVSSSSTSFPPGFQTQIFFTARTGQGGAIIPATFTFESLNPEIATMAVKNNTGLVTAVAPPTDGTTKAAFKVTATPVSGGPAYTFTTRPITVETPVSAPLDIYAKNDEFGDPTPASAANPDDMLLVRPQYTLSYNQSRGTPNWVSYELDARQMVSGQDRCNCFTADPGLPADKQIFTSDYTNGGYDRGHMTRSADRTVANVDNASTFYLTNIVPQQGDLNQGVWAQFENALGDSARAGRAVYIITGPLYSRSKTLTYIKNEGKIAIPDSTWKVAFVGPRNGGVPFDRATMGAWGSLAGTTVLAVNMPNVAGVRNNPWSMYLTTVDRIEEATGYDFLSVLPTAFQAAIEAGDHAPTARFTQSGTLAEGSALAFDASTSSDPDLGSTTLSRPEALSFSWTFGDGTTATGATPSKTFANDGSYTVTLTVTDAYGWEMTSSSTITIANVAPEVAAFSGATILEGETYAASGSFADPGSDTWTATVNYGDGSGDQSLALADKHFALSHPYAGAGSYTVTVKVNDGLATTTRSATVVVETAATGVSTLANMIGALGNDGTLEKGEVNSLQAKLDAAGKKLVKHEDKLEGKVLLESFVNELQAMVNSGRLSESAAAPLIAYAERVSVSAGL